MARVIDPHLGFVGVWAAGNPYTEIPDGALGLAAECVVRQAGVVSPRPGFKLGTNVAALTSIEQLIAYNNQVLHIGSGATKTYWPPSTHVLSESGAELPWTRDEIRGVEARKNLYLTTSNAPRKLTSAGDATAGLCGAVPPAIIFTGTSGTGGTVIAQNQAVAYVAVLESTDPSGLVVTSAPSGRGVVQRTIAGIGNVTVSYAWCNAQIGDVLKVYRSLLTTGAVPGNQYYLCKTFTLAAAGGAANFVDKVAESDLGRALYTNDGEPGGGATRGNYRPPRAAALCLYKDSLIFANITNPPRIQLRWLEGGALATVSLGIGSRAYTGTRTLSSATITSMSSTVGLKIGMLLADATGFAGTAPVTIVSIVAGTSVTVSTTFGGTTGAATVTFCDVIKIGAETHRADTAAMLLESLCAGLGTIRGRTTASTKAFGIGIGTSLLETGGTLAAGTREVLIESILAVNAVTLTIAATHGDEYDPALPEPTATAQNLDSQVLQNVVGWSKTGQPEHFVLVDYSFVGNAQSAILAAFTAGDSAWLLKAKGDGVYRLSGAGELSGFRVDHVDLSTWLLHGSLACALGDTVFCWTNKGLVAIDEGGVVPISKPALGDTYSATLLGFSPAAIGPGTYAVANAKDDEVIFGLPNGDFVAPSYMAVVLNTRTKAFTTWFMGLAGDTKAFQCACYDPSAQLLMFGQTTSGTPAVERVANDVMLCSDVERAITILDVTDDFVSIAAGSGWTPAVGDALYNPAGLYAIVTATPPGTGLGFNIERPCGFAALLTGASTAFEAYACVLSFGQSSKTPALSKRFRELLIHWARCSGVRDWQMSLTALREGAGGSASLQYQFLPLNPYAGGRNHRAIVPDEAGTGAAIACTLTIAQAGANWALNGYTLVFEAIGTRVNA